MWEKIRDKQIIVNCWYNDDDWINAVIPKMANKWGGDGFVRFDIPINYEPIKRGLEMLEFIFRANDKIKGKRKLAFVNSIFFGSSQQIEFLVMISAYLNILYALEGIVKRTYDDLLSCVKGFELNEICPSRKDRKSNKKNRKQEIEKLIQWRHKVFGHTSYAFPQDDNSATQLTSLEYFGGTFGGSISEESEDVNLGGIAIKGTDFKISGKNKVPPSISISKDHSTVLMHFNKWEKMFLDIINNIEKLGKDEIMKKNKNRISRIELERWDRKLRKKVNIG